MEITCVFLGTENSLRSNVPTNSPTTSNVCSAGPSNRFDGGCNLGIPIQTYTSSGLAVTSVPVSIQILPSTH